MSKFIKYNEAYAFSSPTTPATAAPLSRSSIRHSLGSSAVSFLMRAMDLIVQSGKNI